MSLTAIFRSVEHDSRLRRDLRLVPILLAAYAAAFVGDGFVSEAALVLWLICAAIGAGLLVAGRRNRSTSYSTTIGGSRIAAAAATHPQTTTRTRTRRRTLAAACLVAAGAGTAATTRTIATHTGPLPRLAVARAQATVE